MRTLVQRLKRLWNTPVEFYGVDRPEPQAGPWHGLLLFVVLLVILGLLWLIRYLPERTYLVQLPSMSPQGRIVAGEIGGGQKEIGWSFWVSYGLACLWLIPAFFLHRALVRLLQNRYGHGESSPATDLDDLRLLGTFDPDVTIIPVRLWRQVRGGVQ